MATIDAAVAHFRSQGRGQVVGFSSVAAGGLAPRRSAWAARTGWSPTSPNATCMSAAHPSAMTRAVLVGLRDLRVPARWVRAKKFGLA
ncbi:hypothetical protein [Streptomyces afghaniensis]|uniref:hypothetical protein n=1 Tax=Streptomyces afghaniensis TaxID=66865 RepID=UPI0027D7D5EF|nr:hypothetical protein [Streptomyces afghaniensis]